MATSKIEEWKQKRAFADALAKRLAEIEDRRTDKISLEIAVRVSVSTGVYGCSSVYAWGDAEVAAIAAGAKASFRALLQQAVARARDNAAVARREAEEEAREVLAATAEPAE